MKITVTQKDIRHGKRQDCFSCPVGLAIKRHFPRRSVCVGHFGISIRSDEYNSPRSVTRFLDRFDDGKTVKPFSFFLRKYQRRTAA